MSDYVSDVAFTPAVKAEQEKRGSRNGYARHMEKTDWPSEISDDLAAFIALRDGFYFATATADGRPYIQHRGGPKGFLKALDKKRLAFADFSGNKQYISLGNLAENDKAHLFLMDYPGRRRVKIWGRAAVVEDDPKLLRALADENDEARPERAIMFTVEAWDVNCPQHIPQRFTEEEMAPAIRNSMQQIVDRLQSRIDSLEAELAAVRSEQA